jgi:hypothetical protein
MCSRGHDIDGMVPAAYMVGAWRRHRLHSAGDGAAGPVRDRTPELAIMAIDFFFSAWSALNRKTALACAHDWGIDAS